MEQRISGRVRYQLLRDLASGADHNQLADKYDRPSTAIRNFAERNAAVISEIAGDLDNEVSGLWIASRALRLAEYQQDVDEINEVLSRQAERGEELNSGLVKMKHNALKAVAEELGQLPQRIQMTPQQVEFTYKVEGVDPTDVG